MKYLIYYITTGVYVQNAKLFFETIDNFMPNDNKDIIWFSDNFIDIVKHDNINVIKQNILDMPWPLVTMLKMHYIKDNKLFGYDGYFYFNANSKFIKMKESTIVNFKNALNENKIICTEHTCRFENPIKDNYDYSDYAQACFFGGNYDTFFNVCEYAAKYMNEMLLKGIIPEFHDESCYLKALEDLKINRLQNHYGINIDIWGGYEYILDKYPDIFILLHQTYKKFKLRL